MSTYCVSPAVLEHRKQIDDLKKFKNDFRVSVFATFYWGQQPHFGYYINQFHWLALLPFYACLFDGEWKAWSS